ncbi:hypothetical protein Tco_0908095 [Tanacetum coccineum]|uniref:Uncharacterized protein n=1 Tax=Tanacetum coccineum TaxID=301880 RepID=A0ABQ5CMA3_9ASTR
MGRDGCRWWFNEVWWSCAPLAKAVDPLQGGDSEMGSDGGGKSRPEVLSTSASGGRIEVWGSDGNPSPNGIVSGRVVYIG